MTLPSLENFIEHSNIAFFYCYKMHLRLRNLDLNKCQIEDQNKVSFLFIDIMNVPPHGFRKWPFHALHNSCH